jgi:hypothetical protein
VVEKPSAISSFSSVPIPAGVGSAAGLVQIGSSFARDATRLLPDPELPAMSVALDAPGRALHGLTGRPAGTGNWAKAPGARHQRNHDGVAKVKLQVGGRG